MAERSEFARALTESAARLGVSPRDLATVISFETGGTFSPSIYGGKGGKYLGLIQFGPAEQQQYGANAKQTDVEQLQAVERYLTGRGLKPGMDIRDLYSTILAGSPGKYDASDKAAGGAVSSVTAAVGKQMDPHRVKADQLLGNTQVADNKPQPPRRPDGAPGPVNAATPTLPQNVDKGVLSALYSPFEKIVEQQKETQHALDETQKAAMAQLNQPAPIMQQPPPVMQQPPPVMQPDANFAALMLPRIRRGLLADTSNYGLLS